MPSRSTAPGPGRSPAPGLFCHRWCPPEYTTSSVTSTVQTVSPPVYCVQVGRAAGAVLPSSNLATTSQPAVPA